MVKARFWVKLTPSVPRRWLLLLAGMVWTGVGVVLCAMAGVWLSDMEWLRTGIGTVSGLGSGIVIGRFGFSRIVRKNIRRIAQQPVRVCLFAFQAWQSYILILVMVLLGLTLRHSPLPRIIVASIYASIGSGLLVSSYLYYQELL